MRERKFALLDRDGTIIVDKVYLSEPDGIEFADGAIEGMRLLRDAGYTLLLVTNQSGIARGYFDEAALNRIHVRLEELLKEQGIELAAIYYCPHGPDDGCDCRKPAPGMIEAAMRDFGFAPGQAIVIGDSDADMGLAEAAGLPGLRIGEGEGRFPNFLEAARYACRLFEGERKDQACM